MDEFDELYKLFDEINSDSEDSIKSNNDCCNEEMIYDEQNGILVCIHCGTCKTSNIFVNSYCDMKNMSAKITSIYKPLNHLLYKIKEITGNIVPEKTLEWQCYFESEPKPSSVHTVRKILKKNKKTKLNKYAYYFYEVLTGSKLLRITNNEKEIMVRRFIKINTNFNKLKKTDNRKNLLNFHFILHKLLREQNKQIKNMLCIPKLKQTIKQNNKVWDKIK